jgi:S1-C subfamily serine protease
MLLLMVPRPRLQLSRAEWPQRKRCLGLEGVVSIILTSVIPLLQTIDHSSMFDDSDVIFAADGERIRNALDLADRVQSLARGDRVYLTIARRGRRVQICMAVSP